MRDLVIITVLALLVARGRLASSLEDAFVNTDATRTAEDVAAHWTKERLKGAKSLDFHLDLDENGNIVTGGRRRILAQESNATRARQEHLLRGTHERFLQSDMPYTNHNSRIMKAAGRIWFEFDGDGQLSSSGYVCSGTVIVDGNTGQSVILTAAHCAYDDVSKRFADYAMFIPQQDGTRGSRTDGNCANDPHGCFVASYAVVERNWARRTFPSNAPWDWAFYVVPDTGAHIPGFNNPSFTALDQAVSPMTVDFNGTSNCCGGNGALAGYSANRDPDFRYCNVNYQRSGPYVVFPNCGLGKGSSGGPGISMAKIATRGPLQTVVSWGGTCSNSQCMGGPFLPDTLAGCTFHNILPTIDMNQVQNHGIVVEADGSNSCRVRSGLPSNPPPPANDPPPQDDPDAATWGIVIQESFDNGWGKMNEGGADAALVRSPIRSQSSGLGTLSVRLRDNSGEQSSMYSDAIKRLRRNGCTKLRLTMNVAPVSLEFGESLVIESWSKKAGWEEVQRFTAPRDFQNNHLYKTVTVWDVSANKERFRVRADASGKRDYIYVDNVEVEALCTGSN